MCWWHVNDVEPALLMTVSVFNKPRAKFSINVTKIEYLSPKSLSSILRMTLFFISLVRGPPWSAFWKFSWSVVRLGPLFSKIRWSASGPVRGQTFRSVDPWSRVWRKFSPKQSLGQPFNILHGSSSERSVLSTVHVWPSTSVYQWEIIMVHRSNSSILWTVHGPKYVPSSTGDPWRTTQNYFLGPPSEILKPSISRKDSESEFRTADQLIIFAHCSFSRFRPWRPSADGEGFAVWTSHPGKHGENQIPHWRPNLWLSKIVSYDFEQGKQRFV